MAYDPITGMFTEDKPKSNFTYGSGNPLSDVICRANKTRHYPVNVPKSSSSGSGVPGLRPPVVEILFFKCLILYYDGKPYSGKQGICYLFRR
jgi:hypothetical protein